MTLNFAGVPSTMHHHLRPLMNLFRGVQVNVRLRAIPHYHFCHSPKFFPLTALSGLVTFRDFHLGRDPKLNDLDVDALGLVDDSRKEHMPINENALRVQNILKIFSCNLNEELTKALHNCELSLSEDLVLDVLRRNHSDWNSAFQFFNWVSSVTDVSGYTLGSEAYNEILGISGKARQFKELEQIYEEMLKSRVANERSYDIVVHRYASAHKVDDAIEFFNKRKQYGQELDLSSFQSLLMSLCRYKHMEAAESLFFSKQGDFRYDIKTWNIVLNGWCVLRNLRETKRFWNVLIHSKCKPDKYSYGIYINSLCKSGETTLALKLFRAMGKRRGSMGKRRCNPDTIICNSLIDGLCFKKRVPEALEIFHEMDAKGCQRNVGTYNCVIKCMCKIRRMEMVSKLFKEMEEKGGDCAPNDMTYTHLLAAAKKPKDVAKILERMKAKGCKITGDIYNLVLRLYFCWNCEEQVQSIWADMSRDGLGPDGKSYTIMIHMLYDQGRIKDALDYFKEMISKKLTPEPRTMLLVDDMKRKLEGIVPEEDRNVRYTKTTYRPKVKATRNKSRTFFREKTRRSKYSESFK